MAFSNIDPTTPAGNEKKKFGDDRIREFKTQVISNLQEVSNYPASTMPALKTAVWTTATRPTSTELVDRVTGYNTDLGYDEYYDLASTSWKAIAQPILQQWTTTTRPSSPYAGQMGHCTDLDVFERWNGTTWGRVNSPARGDICMWTGLVADISTKKPGWVLANGQSVTIDSVTFTVPDLRSRFIVGAGTDTGGNYTAGTDAVGTGTYDVGASGGADKHTLTTDEIPSHYHRISLNSNEAGQDAQATQGTQSSGQYQNTTSVGGGLAHENRPPYYALCFLYKL